MKKEDTINSQLNPAKLVLSERKNEVSNVEKAQSDEMSLIDLILIFWRGKYVLITCVFLAAIAGVIYALTAKEIFSTSSNFIIKTGNNKGGNISQLAALTGVSFGSNSDANPADYLDKVIIDKEFISKLLERKWFFKGDSLFLEDIYEIDPSDTTIPNWKYVFFMTKVEEIRKSKIIYLRTDIKTGVLTLFSEAPDPQLAYDLNVFTLDYISDYIRNSIKTQAKEKRLFIEDRIKESKQELEKAEDALARFRGRNLMTSSPQILLEEARLLRQVTMNQEIFIQFQKQYELAKIEELDDQTLIQVVKGAEVPVLRSKPKRTMIVIVSTFSGLFIGIFFLLIFLLIQQFKDETKHNTIKL